MMAGMVKQWVLMVGVGAGCLAGLVIWRYILTATNILAVSTSVCLGTFAFLCANLHHRLPRDVSYRLPLILNLYIGKIAFFVMGHWFYNKLNNDSRDIRKSQEESLLHIIQANKETVYGKERGFASISSREDFVKALKLNTYLDLKSFIDQSARGEQGVLTQEPVVQLGTTSGTSGTSNRLPLVKTHVRHFLKCLAITQYVAHHYLPSSRQVRLSLRFAYPARWGKSEGGIPVGPGSTANTSKYILKQFTTPPEAYSIEQEPELCYIHWLFALQYKSVGSVSALFAPTVYNAMTCLHDNWADMVHDMECGLINPNLTIDIAVRKELNALLHPSPVRAAELKEIFEDGFDGIVLRIWPHCQVVNCVDSGSLSLHGDLLRQSYCKGMTFYSSIYGSTEGLMAPNLWPLNRRREYVLLPTVAFYEFIREDEMDREQPDTLFAEQVEVGCVYELVLTTVNGLYRYRFGDVVQISRFHHECPVVEFVYRCGQLLNIAAEKTPEPAMLGAVTRTVSGWSDVQLTEYCCTLSVLLNHSSDVDKSVGHYVVFLEISGQNGTFEISQEQKDMLDVNLCEIYPLYGNYRRKGSIGPMLVHVVHPGTFLKFRQHKVNSTSASSNQFKMPRTLKNKTDVKFFMNHLLL